jgi:hypothetical protein
MADPRIEHGSASTDDPRLLIFECMRLFGELEDLVGQRGGQGKGLGEKVHSLRGSLPELLVAQLLSVVTVRNRITHEIHKDPFSADELRVTVDVCRSLRDQLKRLPSRGAWGGSAGPSFTGVDPAVLVGRITGTLRSAFIAFAIVWVLVVGAIGLALLKVW